MVGLFEELLLLFQLITEKKKIPVKSINSTPRSVSQNNDIVKELKRIEFNGEHHNMHGRKLLTFEIDFFQIIQEFRSFYGFHLFAKAGNVFALVLVHGVQRVRERQHRVTYELQLVFPFWFPAAQVEIGVTVDVEVRVEGRYRAVWIFTLEVFFPKF